MGTAGRPVEPEFFTGLTYGGLLRSLDGLAATGHDLPYVHVLASQHSEFRLVADSAERNDKDLKKGLGASRLLDW